ncbi:protein NRT1/ PTR FAMILY 1.2 [Quillaja saponaria]|uniref:Protein NRT1/ PTR FAMILY 1.2 n=1 Tax=Quillaja saponaria TaxID=32244 RepID=A0AAD7LI17_QUISA|nr:protein NRT1/ PTR FAMILY 1.2 [Quillaja saponaria]
MISFGSIASLLGMTLFWLTTIIPRSSAGCDRQFDTSCSSPTLVGNLVLYCSFALMSVGAGGVRSTSIPFGIDQLSKGEKESGIKESFFNWYYGTSTAAVLIGMTLMTYIQENMGWKVGFGIPVILMFISAVSFFIASPNYIKVLPKTNLLTRFAQVFVASYRKRHLSPEVTSGISYYHEKESELLEPSEKLRFLNKACIIINPLQDLTPDGKASDPWSLCTVEQVQELKTVIRVLPILTTAIMLTVNMSQSSFLVLEASSMDRHVTSNFQIPAGSFGSILIVAIIFWVAAYDRIIVPLASKIRGKPARLGPKQKMGVGLMASCVALASLAVVEGIRRRMAIKQGFIDDPKAVVNLSALWLLPRQFLDGLAEAANIIGQTEFFISELPQSMSSIAGSLMGVGSSIANLLATLILNIVKDVTTRGGNEGWLASNINRGRYDYYYWLIVGLSLLNFLYFLYCCKAYGPGKEEESKSSDEENK